MIEFVQGTALGFSAAASPGPFQAFLLAQTLRNGVARSLPLALAPLASDGPIIALMLLVLTRVPAALLEGLRLAGGLFLLWVAAGVLRSSRTAAPGRPARAEAPLRAFLRGVAMNALSPGPWIFWSLVSGPVLVGAWKAAPARGVAFLAGFYLLLCGGNAALVALFGSARRLGPGTSRALSGLSALALAGFGLWQLGRGLAG